MGVKTGIPEKKGPYARIAPVKRFRLLFALALGGLALPGLVFAQAGAKLTLRHIQSNDFPQVTGFLDARDASGALVLDLSAEDVTVVEDGRLLPVDQLRLAETGLQLVVVIDPSQAFSIRDSEGFSRYELLREELLVWASTQADSEVVSYSLLTSQGSFAQAANASEWLTALENYEPNMTSSSNDLAVLPQALNSLGEPPLPGAGQAVWLISAVPPSSALAGLPDWQDSLLERGVYLFLWLVDAPTRLNSEEAQALQNLAAASGGSAFLFSGEQELPDPEDYFASLSQAYYFQYQSPATSSGEHSVQVQWASEAGPVDSQALSYTLEILPPNPIFVTPPSRIERLPYEEDPRLLSPFSQPLEILIEFPDDFEREIVRSTLLVNGQPVAENSSPPFNNFIWDLQPYNSSQELALSVEVEDELGLVGRSEAHPLQIVTQQPLSWLQMLLARGAPALAFAVLLIAAGAVFVVMVLSGRIAPPALQTIDEEGGRRDPLSESPMPGRRAGQPNPDEALPMPPPRALAYLQGLNAEGRVDAERVLTINTDRLVIGSSAELSNLLVEGDTVEAQHARLTRLDTGQFVLADMGSEAGTWLNYAPVSSEGSRVEEGDLVHFGREAFRFSLLPPKRGSTT